MKIGLDKNLAVKLRDKINEQIQFTMNKEMDAKSPGFHKGKQNFIRTNAFSCICSVLDRIDDLVDQINELNLTDSEKGKLAFYVFFLQSQTLIDCITILGRIYKTRYKADCSIFNQPGINKQGNDEKYFKYLRSLCVVHPTETSQHFEYQGKEPEWSPYILSGKNFAAQLFSVKEPELKGADYVAVVYRNDMEFSKHVPIKVKEIFKYVRKRYAFIEDIIKGIDKYNSDKTDELIKRHILLPKECTSYDDYLQNLEKEVHERLDGQEYVVRKWRAIFKTHFDNKEWEICLEEYKKWMIKEIAVKHKELQDMTCIPVEDWELGLREYTPDLGINGVDKIESYLGSPGAFEQDPFDLAFIDDEPGVDEKELFSFFDCIDKCKEKGMTHDELMGLCYAKDHRVGFNDSEWARILLKLNEEKLKGFPVLDYRQNDWHLYIQYIILLWHIKQKG